MEKYDYDDEYQSRAGRMYSQMHYDRTATRDAIFLQANVALLTWSCLTQTSCSRAASGKSTFSPSHAKSLLMTMPLLRILETPDRTTPVPAAPIDPTNPPLTWHIRQWGWMIWNYNHYYYSFMLCILYRLYQPLPVTRVILWAYIGDEDPC